MIGKVVPERDDAFISDGVAAIVLSLLKRPCQEPEPKDKTIGFYTFFVLPSLDLRKHDIPFWE